MPAPPQQVIDAILNGVTTVTRRVAIYEPDAVTPWYPIKGVTSDDPTEIQTAYEPLMIEGSVSVDSTRDERRNIDLTLDNRKKILTHAPEDFWYDKVIKAYRGITYKPNQLQPKIAVFGVATDPDLVVKLFQNLGYSIDPYYFDTGTYSVDDFLGYDIIVMAGFNNSSVNGTGVGLSIILQLYDMGKSVISIGNYFGTAIPPVASVSATRENTSARTYKFAPSVFGHPFENFVTYTSVYNASSVPWGYMITGLASGAISASDLTTNNASQGSATGPGIVYMSHPNSQAIWIHYHGGLTEASHSTTADLNKTTFNRNRLFNSFIDFLWKPVEDANWEVQVGEFLIDSIGSQRNPKQIKVVGRDYTAKLMDSSLDNATSFAAGTNINTLIKSVASNGGIKKFKLTAPSNLQLSSTQTFSSQTSRWDVIKTIAESIPIEVFFDAFGYLVTRSFFDPATSLPTFTLTEGGSKGNVIDYSDQSDRTEVYNRVVVSGTSPDDESSAALYQGIAENHNSSSPTSIENLGYTRTYYIDSPTYTSNAQCLQIAKSFLAIKGLESFSFDYAALVFAWLEAGEIVRRNTENILSGEPVDYLHDTFTIPLTLDSMSGTAKRVTIVVS